MCKDVNIRKEPRSICIETPTAGQWSVPCAVFDTNKGNSGWFALNMKFEQISQSHWHMINRKVIEKS